MELLLKFLSVYFLQILHCLCLHDAPAFFSIVASAVFLYALLPGKLRIKCKIRTRMMFFGSKNDPIISKT